MTNWSLKFDFGEWSFMVTAKDTTFLYEPQVELQMLIQSTRTKEIPTIMNYI